MTKFIEVITTFETEDEARGMANKIIEARLGACCSIEQIESVYRWEGKVENTKEFQLTIKTAEKLYSKLEAFILKNHSYDIPQIVSLQILKGSSDYLGWLKEETN